MNRLCDYLRISHQRFWHQPVRAETLGFLRFAIALTILGDQLFQFLPHLALFFGPDGIAPAGINDSYLARSWRWTILFFHTDNMTVIYVVFFAWMAATIGMMVGWHSRIMVFLVWLGFLCFLNRNPNLKNGGDDLVQLVLFLLLFAPTGRGFSLDARRRRRKMPPNQFERTLWIAPWSVRLVQIQVCAMYLCTGLAKVVGDTWQDGTSIWYVIHDISRARISWVEFPIPFWVTEVLTYMTLGFELGFWCFICIPWLRVPILFAGIGFHLGIYACIEVGWFSFYTIALYAVWVGPRFWEKRGQKASKNVADANSLSGKFDNVVGRKP